MEINLNTNIESVTRANGFAVRGREASAAPDPVSFESSKALNQALATVPDIRDEPVRRAQQMVGTVTYPPEETVAKIAHLLALQLDRNG